MQRNRILFTILLLFASLVIFGCLAANQITALGPAMIQGNGNIVKEGRPVRTFNRIALAGSGEVILSQGKNESLTLEADDNLMEYIKEHQTIPTNKVHRRSRGYKRIEYLRFRRYDLRCH
jgi:hypothetical protein